MKKLTGLAALTLALCLATLGAFAQTGHANEAIRIEQYYLQALHRVL